MSWLASLFGLQPKTFNDPTALRDALFDAVARKQDSVLAKLCRNHQAMVIQNFPSWTKLPPGVPDKQVTLERYANGLISVAVFFDKTLGDPSLVSRLQGDEKSNPLIKWENDVNRASGLMKEAKYKEAIEILQNCLIDNRQIKGFGVFSWLPATYGTLGECLFHSGEVERALVPLQHAIDSSRQNNFANGVLWYTTTLYQVRRYLGQASEAAALAGQLAQLTSAAPETANEWRTQAAIVRAGEPLNRIVVKVGDRVLEVDQLGGKGDFRGEFIFHRNRLTLGCSSIHLEQGKKEGSAGKYEEARSSFQAATKADPFDPHPHYQQAVTLLHMRRASEAVAEFEETERLAPGWFNCRAEMWLAEQIAAEKLPYEAFDLLRYMEFAPTTPADKLRLAEAAFSKLPAVPILLLDYGRILCEVGRKQDALGAFQRGLDADPEPDSRSRLLMELSRLQPPKESEQSLREAAGLKGNLVAAAIASISLRALEARRS